MRSGQVLPKRTAALADTGAFQRAAGRRPWAFATRPDGPMIRGFRPASRGEIRSVNRSFSLRERRRRKTSFHMRADSTVRTSNLKPECTPVATST